MRIRSAAFLTLILSVPLLLAGCSGHPGAGTWQFPQGAEYRRLVVQFDGRAEFFRPGREQPAQRCFWAGDSARSIVLQCQDAERADIEREYRLKVNAAGDAELMLGQRLVAQLRRQS